MSLMFNMVGCLVFSLICYGAALAGGAPDYAASLFGLATMGGWWIGAIITRMFITAR